MRNQLLSLFVALLATVGSLPMAAQEAYVVLSGGVLTFYYDTQRSTRQGTVYDIPAAKKKPDWVTNDFFASGNNIIKEAVFDDSFAAYRPTSTRSWFQFCKGLKRIEGMQNLNTENVTDMSSMFRSCISLTWLNVSDFSTSKVTDMSYMFADCRFLETLYVSNFNTSKVTNMRNMFEACTKLRLLDLRNFNTENVTDMCFMFSGCEALRSLNIYTWNTGNVIDMSYMFMRCLSLSSLDLISFNTKNVISTKSMFFNCPALTTIYCNSDWKVGGKVLDSRTMFSLDTKLKGDNVSYSYNQIGIEMANPRTGYFTSKSREPYAVLSKGTLTFYYDYWRHTHELTGTIYSLPAAKEVPAWAGSSSNPQTAIQHVVFDKSFDMHRPTSTRSWFEYCVNLQDVKGIEYLNTAEVTDMHGMFLGCTALRSLDVTKFNTAKVITMKLMFSGCNMLNWLDLTKFNVQNVTNTENMFNGCSSLSIIYCNDDWSAGKVKYSYNMFNGCTKLKNYNSSKLDISMANFTTGYFTGKIEAYAVLTKVDNVLTFYCDGKRDKRVADAIYSMPKAGAIPGWAGTSSKPQKDITRVVFDSSFAKYRPTSTMSWFAWCVKLRNFDGLENLNTEKVTDMSNMFYNCESVSYLVLSSFNTKNVTNMRNMFSGCKTLRLIDVSKFNTEKVTNMSGMFADCHDLTSFELTNFNTANVTNMGSMFFGCELLRELDLTNFNTEKVTDVSYMFTNCYILATIFSNRNWKSGNTQSGFEMFKGCTMLKGTNTQYNAIKTGLEMANPTTGYFTRKTTEAYAVLRYGKLTFYYDHLGNTRLGTRYTMPATGQVPGWAGSYTNPQEKIEKAEFDASFAGYRPTSTRLWFFHCVNLRSIEGMRHLNTANVTDMRNMFTGCKSMTSIDVSNFNTANVTNMVSMFSSCEHLETLDLRNFNTAKVTDMTAMFSSCKSLVSLNVTSFNTKNVTDMKAMFSGCEALRSLDVTNFNTENAISMTNMFTSCSSLESIDLNNFNTAKVTDMSGMFRGCNSLLTIYCNNDWKGDGTVGDVMMFLGCLNLKGTNIKYDSKKIGIDMANPTRGYFTSKTVGAEQVAYAVLTEADSTLTFYYDDLRITRSGTDYDMPAAGEMPGWAGTLFSPQKKIKLVVFDKSFADYRPNSTMSWFNSCTKLQTIEGMQNLNTEKVTNMSGMFATCLSLTSIDVSNFNTANVTSMSGMFSLCQALTTLDVSNFNIANVTNMSRMFFNSQFLNTIYCSDDWKEAGKVQSHDMMFLGCNNLRGNNALYNSTKTGIEMANPTTGYFTSKATGIDKMKADGKAGDGKTYDLSGRRVNESYKGIVIKNGKKYIQK